VSDALSIERVHADVVELALAKPLVTSSARIDRRQVIVIRAEITVAGRRVVGFGEASPLAGWTEETVDDCLELLAELDLPVSLDAVEHLDEHFPQLQTAPSLRFGVELALLDALARHREVPLRALLAADGGSYLDQVPVQFTLGAPTDEEWIGMGASLDGAGMDGKERDAPIPNPPAAFSKTVRAARRAVDEGYRCIKLKVGLDSPAEDIARIRRVHRAFPGTPLRLDANGAWTLSEASSVARSLGECGVDLLEQPVAADDTTSLWTVARQAPFDIAADESCVPARRARRLIEIGAVPALVLKPSALGGLLTTANLVDLARSRGIRVVLSTLIDSAIGRTAIAQLAAARPQLAGPHGLATGPWFANDVGPTDRIVDGHMLLPRGPGLGFEPHYRSPRRACR
jgi:L-Ala-D/L-Glu epimerase